LITVCNNLIQGNAASDGGGLCIGAAEDDNTKIYQNIFVDNQAVPDHETFKYGGRGGAIYSNIGHCRPWIYNNTFYGNGAWTGTQYQGEGGTILYWYEGGHGIFNNIIANTVSAEAVKIKSGLPHDYNCFWKNNEGDYIYWASYGSHDIHKKFRNLLTKKETLNPLHHALMQE
jgi:hypothetical protein